MGKCSHCDKDIKLSIDDKTCPHCGKNPYHCWKCGESISKKPIECPICHFFVCNSCGNCGYDCVIDTYLDKLDPHINLSKTEQISIINEIIEEVKGPARRNCVERSVPISYAKGKLRNIALKIKGYNIKSEADLKAFNEKYMYFYNFPIGYTWSINGIKEDGRHGHEEREISYMLVCLGLAKIIRKKHEKSGVYYDLFERINGNPCNYLNWNNLIKKTCPKCKIIYFPEATNCSKCNVELKIKRGEINFCQLARSCFVKKKSDKNEDTKGNN